MKSKDKERLILGIIKYAPSSIVIILAFFVTLYISLEHTTKLQQEKNSIKEEYLFLNKDKIKIDIKTVNNYVRKSFKESRQQLHKELHNKINVIHDIAMNIYERNKEILSSEQIITQIKIAIENIRYHNGNGYFSIHTMSGMNILHPINRDFENTLVLDRKDSSGKHPVKEAIYIANTKGEGVFSWHYFKPNDASREFKKIGIVKKFEPYNLIITTALFEEDFNSIVENRILEHLSQIEYQDKGYIFVVNKEGSMLLTKSNLKHVKDESHHYAQDFKSFVDSKQSRTYIQYSLMKGDKEFSKISYLQKANNGEWIIGTGFNLDKLNLMISKKQKELNIEYKQHLNFVLISVLIITSILLILSWLLSQYLERLFFSFKKQLFEKELEKLDNYQQTITSLVNLIEQRDFYTAGHSYRVSHYSTVIAEAMDFKSEDINMLQQIGLLHDIGKISIPDSILLKPGKLTKQEFDIIKCHTTLGYDVVSKIPMFKDFANIILSHHERYDGTGYPNGLKGDEIPPLASVLSIADSFDAMTSRRIYNQRKTAQEALLELEKESGILFDPKILRVALQALQKIDINHHLQESQLPKTAIEKERFAYFFKDGLTNISNENYFDLLLKQDLHQYRCLNLILIHNFSLYNDKYGWTRGDELLIKITKFIQKKYKTKELFRFQGVNFILLNDTHIDIDITLLEKEIKPFSISCELIHSNLNTFEKFDILKEYLNKI
ncbi:hypothetical protein ALC152_22370 [Arcobacter sp. 15-2]|uniref:cache domain-containing protein n=1 Tax=Arcobacter sp. 15-2 TaxID=3374109 RepID=UPI00399CF83F